MRFRRLFLVELVCNLLIVVGLIGCFLGLIFN